MNVSSVVWSRPVLLEQVLRRRRDGRAEVMLRIPALAQGRRALWLEQALHALPGIAAVSLDNAAQRARVVFDEARLPLVRLLAACARVDCEAQPLHRDSLDDSQRAALDASLKRLVVAWIFAMQAMMFALVLYIGVVNPLDATTAHLFRWLGLLSAIPVVGYAAWPFYRDALAGLRARRAGIDVPVALAIVLVFAAGVLNAVRGGGEVYFDSISMFVFVLLLGRHLELRAQARHRALGAAAAEALPLVALRRQAGGGLETVAVVELEPGDRVHVPEGGATPCDGVLESECARIDESRWTGEAKPHARRRGDAIVAGSVSVDGPLELRVERGLAASGTAALERLADAARRDRDVAGDADRPAARRFVWRVLALALATAAFWLWRDPARAFDATVAVLVVACPCAFGLAAPAVLTRTLALLSRHGVLVARAAALRTLARAGRALFDKTGTLTEPALDIAGIRTFRGLLRDDALRLAVALARESGHPVARALAGNAGVGNVPWARDVEVVAGKGVRGVVDGHGLRLGRAGFAGAMDGADEALWLADDAGPLARLPVTETLRADARACVDGLRKAGIVPALASGDALERVQAVAAQLGIGDWAARQSPSDKLARVRSAQAGGAVVLAVGDGGNDAAALAAADVSAAPGDAVELARARADLLLPGGLAGLPLARRLSLRAMRILAQNRRWSLAWNLGAVPFAALGFVPPWLAALGMSASSLAVVLNTLRIREPRPRGDAPAGSRGRIA
ncbi:MAG TPA: heavy metal translocating P-type ATPase [Rhodanobacteraceae bacterium]|nr:heavy metal translocating P-type ATPase [Rhodanobacteraceae bacterium]